jgi:hypothetical protein
MSVGEVGEEVFGEEVEEDAQKPEEMVLNERERKKEERKGAAAKKKKRSWMEMKRLCGLCFCPCLYSYLFLFLLQKIKRQLKKKIIYFFKKKIFLL